MNRFTDIVDTATKPKSAWTNRETVQFHYFNKNGAVQKHRSMCGTIAQYVNDGIVPSGWHLAYGTFADYSVNLVTTLSSKKRVSGRKMRVALSMLQDDTDRGYTKLAELHTGE